MKTYERIYRYQVDSIEVDIRSISQPLPVEMDRFWSSNTNKTKLQQEFIKWIARTFSNNKENLRGCHEGALNSCKLLRSGELTELRLLYCEHEEADERMLFPINHAVKVDKLENIIVASSDTDVFACLIYHSLQWMLSSLKELWFLAGQGTTKRAIPVHNIIGKLEKRTSVFSMFSLDTVSI